MSFEENNRRKKKKMSRKFEKKEMEKMYNDLEICDEEEECEI
jgi:hypothetical protein